jgi:hypothetical protein
MALAIPDLKLMMIEVDVLDAQSHGLNTPQPGTI